MRVLRTWNGGATRIDRLRGRRILVVEDEYFIAVDMAERLKTGGAVVVGPVATVGKALSLIETERLDGAVLDLNLAGEMGFRVADALKQRAIPFVLATAYAREDIPPRLADLPLFRKQLDAREVASALFQDDDPRPA